MNYEIDIIDVADRTQKQFVLSTAQEAQRMFKSLADRNILVIRFDGRIFRHNPFIRGLSLVRKSPFRDLVRKEKADILEAAKQEKERKRAERLARKKETRVLIKSPVVINVRLGQSDVDFFREFGSGSISAGIRKAASVLSTGL